MSHETTHLPYVTDGSTSFRPVTGFGGSVRVLELQHSKHATGATTHNRCAHRQIQRAGARAVHTPTWSCHSATASSTELRRSSG